jgi:hypothetical protein
MRRTVLVQLVRLSVLALSVRAAAGCETGQDGDRVPAHARGCELQPSGPESPNRQSHSGSARQVRCFSRALGRGAPIHTMSAKGQKRTWSMSQRMSALGQEATLLVAVAAIGCLGRRGIVISTDGAVIFRRRPAPSCGGPMSLPRREPLTPEGCSRRARPGVREQPRP